jgi:hypothetical protein
VKYCTAIPEGKKKAAEIQCIQEPLMFGQANLGHFAFENCGSLLYAYRTYAA